MLPERSLAGCITLNCLCLCLCLCGVGSEWVTCDAPPRQLRSFAEFEAFSLAHWQQTVVVCGFFDEELKRSGEAWLASLHERVGRDNEGVRLAWTAAADSTSEGGDLTGLFQGDTRCHVFKHRTEPALSAPEHSVESTSLDAALVERLLSLVDEVSESSPVDPHATLRAHATTGHDGHLIDYGSLDRAAVRAATPSVRSAMCGGASTCEVERRSGLTSAEFLNEYYLWGRPVIITDAMDSWPLMKTWSEEYLRAAAPALTARRKRTGDSQLLSALDKEEQLRLREDYAVPDFLRGFVGADGESRDVELDTELFFFGERGAKGLPMHLDTGCHQYWVPHIKGRKKWTLVPIESRQYSALVGRDPAFHLPELTATVGPGEILVFYSGWRHKTEYIDADDPTLSFTMYMHEPVPKFYLDEFRHDLLVSPEYSTCMNKWFAPEMIVGGRRH